MRALPTPVETLAPFSMRGAGTIDRARALQCLTAAIYFEAGSESDAGQQAVAQVVLNRVRHPAFPSTVCGVVYQGMNTARCQFSFACDGAERRMPSRTGWARALQNAASVLAGRTYAPVGLATHYHTFAVTPDWTRTLVMTAAIGAHFFHRWKGAPGALPAFSQQYRGGEIMPHFVTQPKPVETVPEVTASVAPQDIPAIAPTESASPSTDTQILERWKDSGQPLR